MSDTIITFRTSEEIKESSKELLQKKRMTISEYCNLCLEYLVQTGNPAVKKLLIAAEDKEVEQILKLRHKNSKKPLRVTLDD